MNTDFYLEVNDLKKIPKSYGVYRFYNKNKDLIYIGKAKDLNSRVSSYFVKNEKTLKTYSLVKNIKYINFTIVNNENEAYLLENNLIKKFKPRYNILLKDSRSYPYLVITKEDFPRIIASEYAPSEFKYIFGPFSNRSFMYEIRDFIIKICKIRSCKFDLNKSSIKNNKYKTCLEYHLERCSGICQNYVNFVDYNNQVKKAIDILNGNFTIIKKELKNKMLEYSKKEDYKMAQKCKNNLELLSTYESTSIISNPKLKELDVFYVEGDRNEYYCSYLIISGGLLIFNKNDVFYNVSCEEIYSLYRDEYKSKSCEIISNIEFEFNGKKSKVPKLGDKKKLIDICKKNLEYFRHELKIKNTLNIDKTKVLNELKDVLDLKKIPFHIECFDNSNLQGTNPVSSCVVFKNGEPSKEDYRKFNVKTVIGADDFKTMEEVIFRRYNNNPDLPDLIIIDGGKGQLNSAVKVLKKLKILGKVDIFGLAKEFEEIYFYKSNTPVILNKNSDSLHLIQTIRDEAHRFAITFHRKKRSDNFLK